MTRAEVGRSTERATQAPLYLQHFKMRLGRGAWPAQPEERVTLNLGVMGLKPTSGVEISKKIMNLTK